MSLAAPSRRSTSGWSSGNRKMRKPRRLPIRWIQERDGQRVRQEINHAEQEISSFGGKRGQFALEFESASQRVMALSVEITGVRSCLDQKKKDESESKLRLDTMRAEFATALGKRA